MEPEKKGGIMKTNLRKGLILIMVTLALSLTQAIMADVPEVIDYHGMVKVDGIPFNGSGYFKFAIVDSAGTTSYWSNDGTSVTGSEPENAVSVSVSNGIFDIRLGDTTITNMRYPVPADIFIDYNDTYLRIWFNDGVNGFQHLTPDKQIVSVPYAHHAAQAANSDTLGGLSAPLAGDLVGTSASQEISNKTIDGSSNTIQNVSDSALSQITTADKVAGSALQLASDSGLEDNSGLKVKTAGGLSADANGLKLDIYDAIVASSGGDYSTVAAACAGESAGAVIFICNGAYTETADIELKDGQKLIGASRDGVVITLGDHQLIANGDEGYGTSTVSISNGSSTVTGSSTVWTQILNDNDYIILNGVPYQISEVVSDTELTLADVFQGESLSGADYYAGTFLSDIELRNFTVTGHAPATGEGAVYLQGVINSLVENVCVSDNSSSTQGLYIDYGWNSKINDCEFSNNSTGMYLRRVSNSQISAIFTHNNSTYGIGLADAQYNNCSDISSINNNLTGIHVSGSTYNDFNNIQTKNNNYYGINIWSGSSYNNFSNISSADNSTDLIVHGTYSRISNSYVKGMISVSAYYTTVSGTTAESISLASSKYCRIIGSYCTGTGDTISESTYGDYNVIVGCTADGIVTNGANTETAGNVIY